MRIFTPWNLEMPQKSRIFAPLVPKWPTSTGSGGVRSASGSVCHNFCMACAICSKRKEKRFCPAIHGRICPQCCGEQREVTLDCPSSCVYLQQAREHEKPRPIDQLDQASLFPEVELGQGFFYEHEHLLLGLSFALAKSTRADNSLNDVSLIGAVRGMAKSLQTLVNSGLHVDAPPSSAAQHAVVAEIQTMLREFREAETKHMGYSRLRDSDVLRALVFLVRLGEGRTSGRPRSRAFVDFLFAQFPEKQSALATPQEPASRIITP